MLTRKAASGVGLMLAANILGRAAGIVSQIVAGAILLDEDFGVFAMAIGITTLSGMLRGGEIQNYLVSLPPTRRRLRNGSVFWVSELLYLIGVVPTILLAPSIARWFDQPDLTALLWLLSASMLLAPVRFVLRSRLNAELRFGTNAMAGLINTLVQYPLTILLAILLRSPLALGIPVLIGVAVEILYLFVQVRPHPADFIPSGRLIWKVLHRLRWLIAVAAMTSLWNGGDYMIAEFLVPPAVLGTYYLGYQLAVQPGRLFMTAVTNVLVPVVRRVGRDKARLAAIMHRMIGTGGLGIAIVNLSILASIESLEAVIWAGKWQSAVLGVQTLSIGLTYTAILSIAATPLLAERRYFESFLINAVRAIAVVGGAGTGALLFPTSAGIAGTVATFMATTSILAIAGVAARMNISIGPLLIHLARCTLPIAASALISAWIGRMILDEFGRERPQAIFATIACLASYAALTMVATRLIPPQTRRETIGLIPARLRRPLGLGSFDSQE